MPILTRRSCANTFQEVFERPSEHHAKVTLSSDTLFSLDTCLPRVIDGSESVASFGIEFCTRSLLSCRKLPWSPFVHWPSSSHWKKHFPPPPLNPFRFLTTAVFLFSCLASDLSFWSILLSTIVFNFWKLGVDILDEFPCRTILTRFWVDQTHVFSICTDFPGHHRMESLT